MPFCQTCSLPLLAHSAILLFSLISATHIILSLKEMQEKKDQDGAASQRPKLADLHLLFKQPHTILCILLQHNGQLNHLESCSAPGMKAII